jgi:Na+-translocating ferredoxin:NAD+ oxidoreductase subunit E
MAKTIVQEFKKGLWDEIPPFRLVLGTLPDPGGHHKPLKTVWVWGWPRHLSLYARIYSYRMLRSVIPQKSGFPCFIIIIATFVIMVELADAGVCVWAFSEPGYIHTLIVVNCIVLGRAEAFASKNKVPTVLADGLGIGVGYHSVARCSWNAARIFGQRNDFGKSSVFGPNFQPFEFMVQAPGAFVALGSAVVHNEYSWQKIIRIIVPTVSGKTAGDDRWATSPF